MQIFCVHSLKGYWGKGKTFDEARNNAYVEKGDQLLVSIYEAEGEDAVVVEAGNIRYQPETAYYVTSFKIKKY